MFCDNIKATVNKRSEVFTRRTKVNSISESDLSDYIKNDAVTLLNIIQSETGKYLIVATLNWKEGDWCLMTSRGKVREWVSLDRLAKHIREKYDGKIPPISLTLASPCPTGESSNEDESE